MKVKIFTVLLLLIMLVLVFPLIAKADRCIIVPRDDVVLSEPGQKAFIAHNGQEELLILSTDVKASKSVSVLEFMPLPSRPEVSLAQEDCFTNLKELVKRYNLYYPPVYRIMAEEAKSGEAAYDPVELIFHQKLGVHDVTAVKINDMTEFVRWIKDYFKKSKVIEMSKNLIDEKFTDNVPCKNFPKIGEMIKTEALPGHCKASNPVDMEDFKILLEKLKEIVLKPNDI